MITDLKYDSVRLSKEIIAALLMLPLFLVFSTVGLDFYYSKLNKSSFYFTESIMFSSFWLLFFPFLVFQFKMISRNQRKLLLLFTPVLLITLHLIAYPALIWFLSKIFYYHTYSYLQTLYFGLTEYLLIVLVIYGISPVLFLLLRKIPDNHLNAAAEENSAFEFLDSLLVSEGNNKKTVIRVEDILFFSSNTPYVFVHHKEKKYLSDKTLKFLEANLNTNQFVRIHKSYIVNLKMVKSFRSRLNGDYDLTLSDNTVLRLSRNYAADFKNKVKASHHHKQK